MARTITARTRQLLAAAQVDGLHVRLTEQVTPREYADVKKALEALGGKWTRSVQALVFPTGSDPAALIAGTLDAGKMPLHAKTAEGFVRTPDDLAGSLARYANVGELPADARVLEPSAGDGAIVRAIRRANPHVGVWAVEQNAQRAALIDTDPGACNTVVKVAAFEDVAASLGEFDAVVMNPPFAVPGNATIWMDHARLAYGLVKPGGRLVAIVPPGFTFRSDKRHTAMRELVDAVGGSNELPRDSFAESGAPGIGGVVVWLDKPKPAAPAKDWQSRSYLAPYINGPTGAQDDTDGDELHHPDGSHVGTARTANGHDVERHERLIREHLAAHAAGTIPPHRTPATPSAQVPNVYPLDLGAGTWATVSGVDPAGQPVTLTGYVGDPRPCTRFGREVVAIRAGMATPDQPGPVVYLDPTARVELPDLTPNTAAGLVAVCAEIYTPSRGGTPGSYRTETRKVTADELARIEADEYKRVIAKVHPLTVTEPAQQRPRVASLAALVAAHRTA